ncbi:hypothetical protein PIROE2DRAFT_1760 [Piromyces sp. E2]|nr:hypothetical protein PIROE2DRAFT_1760 [Piromyces sp. E2]|eukprot:OUM70083.1 hypothetical protein PIROE2DRAFT_1760 [Piromyces sp. E2]
MEEIKIGNDTDDNIINSFNSLINFDVNLIPNYEKNKSRIYEDILHVTNVDDFIYLAYPNFLTKLGKIFLSDIYERDGEIDVYSLDNYKKSYFKLLFFDSYPNTKPEEEINENFNEEYIFSLTDDCPIDVNDKIVEKALIFRQIKTVNKMLMGEPLSELDIYFTKIFCESNISLQYNMNVFVKSLSKILEGFIIFKDFSDIYDLFNKNQFPSSTDEYLIKYLQSTIRYYTNNNNDNKYVGLYSTFNVINSYIYYSYNINKQYNIQNDHAKAVYNYLMGLENIEVQNQDKFNLNEINLSKLDHIIKKNIITIFEEIKEKEEKIKMNVFFSGLYQIMEYFSIKNNMNVINNNTMGLKSYKEDITKFSNEVDDLRKLKIFTDTVNNIILQINYTKSNIKITNPKNPDSKIFLRPYLIIKQDRDVENTSNFLENIKGLKDLNKYLSKNELSDIGGNMYYQDITSYTINNESIGGLNDESFIQNFINLFNNTIEIKKNNDFREYIFSKYQLLSKIYYDIKNYYLDYGAECINKKSDFVKFIKLFDKFSYSTVMCFNESLKDNYGNTTFHLEQLKYIDNKLTIDTIDQYEEDDQIEKEENINMYDLNRKYDEIIYYNQFEEDNGLDEKYLLNFNLEAFTTEFKSFAKELETIKFNIAKNNLNSMETDIEKIIKENSNILFDNYIDKNYLIDNTIMYQTILSLYHEPIPEDGSEQIDEDLEKFYSEVIDPNIYSYTNERNININQVPYYFIYYGVDEFLYNLSVNHFDDVLKVIQSDEELTNKYNEIFSDLKLKSNVNLPESNSEIPLNKRDEEINENDDDYYAKLTNNNIDKISILMDVLNKYLEANQNKSLKKRTTTNDNKENEDGTTDNDEDNNNKNNNSQNNLSFEGIDEEFEQKMTSLISQLTQCMSVLSNNGGKQPNDDTNNRYRDIFYKSQSLSEFIEKIKKTDKQMEKGLNMFKKMVAKQKNGSRTKKHGGVKSNKSDFPGHIKKGGKK